MGTRKDLDGDAAVEEIAVLERLYRLESPMPKRDLWNAWYLAPVVVAGSIAKVCWDALRGWWARR